MIGIIILTTIAFIIYSFFSDREKMKIKIDSEGGMQIKYAILINHLTYQEDSKILKVSRDHLFFKLTRPNITSYFNLTQSFNNLIVTWKAKGTFGELNEKWEFPSNMNQTEMAEKIIDGIDFKARNMMNFL